MDVKSLVPFRGSRAPARRHEDAHPLNALRREMDQVFDDFFRGFGFPLLVETMPAAMAMPRLDVSETEQEIQIAAEMPGVEEKDIEVILAEDVLTIRGERRAEEDKTARDFHLVERSQGSFVRSLRLPFSADASQVKASFQNGVLTIAVPKPKEVQQKARKIALTKSDGAGAPEARQQEGQKTEQTQAAAE
jgi:HSP20 family protein